MNLEQEAREWLEANTKVRWATEPEYGVTPDELNRRPAKYASWLAGFARQQVKMRDRKIADDLEALCDPYDTALHIAVKAYAAELRGEGE